MDSDYPLRFDVDYPDRDLDRLSTLLRFFYLIPIGIVLLLVSGSTSSSYSGDSASFAAAAGGIVVAATTLMILFRKKYPRWWFDWNLELTRFTGRVTVYAALLDDRYPSTDERQSLRLDIP